MTLFRGSVVLAAIGMALFVGQLDLADRTADLRNAVSVIAGASATLLGFLVSAGALLYAVANTRLAENLQRTGHFRLLLKDLFVAAGCFLIALLFGFVCLFLPVEAAIGEHSLRTLELGVLTLVFLNVVAYAMLLPVGFKLWILLSNLGPEPGSPLE